MKQPFPIAVRTLTLTIAAMAVGCSSVPKIPGTQQASAAVEPSASTPVNEQSLKLTYRTQSSRLNTTAGLNTIAAASGVQPISYQPSSYSPVPDFTTSTLDIRYPHPAGIPDFAAVTVSFESQLPDSEKPTSGSWIWNTIKGTSADASAEKPSHAFREVWTTDLPRWQLDSLIAKLKKENFFMRAKVMNSNSFLATELDGVRFGKNYKQVAELDAMILRVRSEGRQLNPSTALPEPIRLPPVQ